jgi:transposase
MAYIFKNTKRNDGSITYGIFEVNRIPGTKNRLKTKCVEKINSAEALANGIRDPLEYAQERLQAWKDRLSLENSLRHADVTIPLGGTYRPEDEQLVNLGYAVYSKLYHLLGLDGLINMRRQHTDAAYNANVILQHLVYSRCLWPDSKLGSWEGRSRFYGQTDYTLDSVYRCMDNLLSWRDDILDHLNRQIRKRFGRKETVLYYDVTNYYFERDDNDGDEGLRARGVSKEHRPEPIVQMGLFMDELGLPITYDLYRGNTADSKTFNDALDKAVIDFRDRRRIIVADKGMMTYFNILKIRSDRNGYVMSQSIRKSDSETVGFALDDSGWTDVVDPDTGLVTCRIKERTTLRTPKSYGLVDGRIHTGKYNERQVFVWSRKYADRAKLERQAAVEKAMQYAGTKSMDFRDSTYGKLKYLKKTPVLNGEDVKADTYRLDFNEEALDEDARLDGYYIVVTNVVGLEPDGKPDSGFGPDHSFYGNDGFLVFNKVVSAQDILDIYGGLWRIEETFKVTKTGMLNLRPVFHSRQDRIRAHFLICFISLLLERILERKLDWKLSAATIQEKLSSFNSLRIVESNVWQSFGYTEETGSIFRRMQIGLPGRCFVQAELRNLYAATKKDPE